MKEIKTLQDLQISYNGIFKRFDVLYKPFGSKIVVVKRDGIIDFYKTKNQPISLIDLVCNNSYNKPINILSKLLPKIKDGVYYFTYSEGQLYNDNVGLDFENQEIKNSALTVGSDIENKTLILRSKKNGEEFILKKNYVKQESHKTKQFSELCEQLISVIDLKQLELLCYSSYDLDSEVAFLKLCSKTLNNSTANSACVVLSPNIIGINPSSGRFTPSSLAASSISIRLIVNMPLRTSS
jgi:hypothetical protein